jgi:prolyl-tRNA editing enzyme YbaK/EbsC (Cys-tRNA(Pro) deacylase)
MNNDRELAGVNRVTEALKLAAIVTDIVQLPTSTRTAAQAAQAIGCDISQIAKTLVFRTVAAQRPIIAVVSGSSRVSLSRLTEVVGEPVAQGDAEFAKRVTGFSIGSIAPLSLGDEAISLIDVGLSKHTTIWAAAGGPCAVMALSFDDLQRLFAGSVRSFTE